uniref:Basal-body rod modification protein FlgD n=1 Tax=Magnetococcus massalia (strain MO-1) TaxID=451514 RepID=A0A1S7LKP2_MAGMO|nr:putative flagellar hook assembly protein flgD [Candidatus Magnetococcus massalia]
MSTTGIVGNVPVYNADAGKYVDSEKNADDLQNDFLRMLTAQLEYQDPLEPMENTEFTAQMAQFTTLGEQQRMTQLMEQLVEVSSQGSGNMNNAVSYIGRDVLVGGNSMQSANGQAEVNFELSKAGTVEIAVYNNAGEVLKTVSRSYDKGGIHSVDMNDPLYGEAIADGNYNFRVNITDAAEGTTVETLTSGLVSGVVNDPTNGVKLEVEGSQFDLADVRRIQLSQ